MQDHFIGAAVPTTTIIMMTIISVEMAIVFQQHICAMAITTVLMAVMNLIVVSIINIDVCRHENYSKRNVIIILT